MNDSKENSNENSRNKFLNTFLPPIILSFKNELSDSDYLFLKRVYQHGIANYINRLKSINFEDLDFVLDAGCGFGQWSISLSFLNNKNVFSIDQDPQRISFLQKMIKNLNVSNIFPKSGSIENLPYKDNKFDSVFSYSVLYFSDYRKSLLEFHRVMKSNGKLYICSNGLGWYLYNLLQPHNPSSDFDPRKMAMDTLKNTLDFHEGKVLDEGGQIVISAEKIVEYLTDLGFRCLQYGEESSIGNRKKYKYQKNFEGKFCGIESVYEIIAIKV